MGGLLKSPQTKPAQMATVVTPIAASTEASSSSLPEQTAQEERIASLKRQARGRAAMIATSPRGLLALSPTEPTRKSLLGE